MFNATDLSQVSSMLSVDSIQSTAAFVNRWMATHFVSGNCFDWVATLWAVSLYCFFKKGILKYIKI